MIRRRLLLGAVCVPVVLLALAMGVGQGWSATGIADDEYAVYSAVIEDYFVTGATGHEGNPDWIVLRSQIDHHPNRILAMIGLFAPGWAGPRLDRLPFLAKWSWLAKGFRDQSLERRFHLTLPYVLLPPAEIDSEESPESLAQYAVIPSAGYVRLTRVGFDLERRFALVYFEHICGLCEGGHYALLERVDGVWKIIDEAWTWVS